jgi:hypothetical protein
MSARTLEIRGNLKSAYPDVFTPEAVAALEALAGLDADRKQVMAARIERRGVRARNKERIAFLDPQATIARTKIKVQEARDGADRLLYVSMGEAGSENKAQDTLARKCFTADSRKARNLPRWRSVSSK